MSFPLIYVKTLFVTGKSPQGGPIKDIEVSKRGIVQKNVISLINEKNGLGGPYLTINYETLEYIPDGFILGNSPFQNYIHFVVYEERQKREQQETLQAHATHSC